MPEADDLSLLIEAARAVGEIARGFFGHDPQVWEKPDGAGPVTEADLAVNAALEERLMAARPHYGWLSEESPDSEMRQALPHTFIVDPLDGTRAFIQGDGTWAHSLAIAKAGEVVAGVVYLPMYDKLYAAARGQGATLNGVPIAVSARDGVDGATVLASRINYDPWHWVGAEPPVVERHFRSSLAYRMSLVAEGRFDAMLTLRPTWEWDVAAGTLLVTEAGGRVSDKRGLAPRFNNPRPLLDGLVAAGPMVQADLTDRLI